MSDSRTASEMQLFNEELQSPYLLNINNIGILSYTLAQSDLAIIDSIYFMNNTTEDLTNLVCEITFEFDFMENLETKIDELKAGEFVEISPKFSIHAKKLFDLTESLKDIVRVTIKDNLGKVYGNELRDLPVLPINQWSGQSIFPETIASFVTPNTPQVLQLLSNASQHLKTITGSPSFVGYDDNKNNVRKQIAAIYSAIYEQKIAYATIPPSFEKFGQRIRSISEMLDYKIGNCVEMAILFCAIAEASGLNPFIVITKGHAFAGVWLTDQNFENNVIDDYSAVNKRLASGINEIEVLECTGMNSDQNIDFESAVQLARQKLEDNHEFELVVDIRRTHYSTIRPMPQLIKENGETKVIDYGLADDAIDKGIVKRTIEDYYLSANNEQESTKAQVWMRNLLDLSKRNSLISFKPGNKNAIQLINSNLMELEDEIADGAQFEIREITSDFKHKTNSMRFVDINTHSQQVTQISETEFKAKRIRTFLEKTELDKRLKSISRESVKSLEENGANTLFLAVGFLEWVDKKGGRNAEGKHKSYLAPLVLLPIDLINHSKGNYSIQLRDEDPQFNVTLLELLRQEYNLNINNLIDLPLDGLGVDLKLVFNTVRKAIMDFEGWDVHEIAFIGLFSFAQFVMWNDLKLRFDKLTENKIVKGLVDGYYEDESESIVAEQLDNVIKVKDLAIPSHTDSSQMTAIISAAKGESFVLHGPPGTGKSQTITNMIANALYQGKSVLFVAEKMAALNVVQERLEKIGLGDFALELHSNKTNKSVVLEKLEHNLSLKSEFSESEFIERTKQIEQSKNNLNEEVFELHKVREQGFSLYDFILLHTEYNVFEAKYTIEKEVASNLTKSKLEDLQDTLNGLLRSLTALSQPVQNHPLREFKKDGYSLSNKGKINPLLEKILLQTNQINDLIIANDSNLLNLLMKENISEILAEFIISAGEFDIQISAPMIDSLSQRSVIKLFEKYSDLKDKSTNNIEIISQKYNSAIVDFDWLKAKAEFNQATNSIFLLRNKKIKNSLESLNNLTLSSFEVTKENALAEFDIIAELQDYINQNKVTLQELKNVLLKELKLDQLSDQEVEQYLVLTNLIQSSQIKEFSNRDKYTLFNLIKNQKDVPNGESLVNQFETLIQLFAELKEISGADLYSIVNLDKSLERVTMVITDWINSIEEWQVWSYFYNQLIKIKDYGLVILTEELLAKPFDKNHLYGDVMKSLAKAMILYYLEDSSSLAKFNRLEFETQINKYNILIDEYEKLSQKAIYHKLSQNIPDRNKVTKEENEQLAKLTRIIRSKGRGVSIRNIFEQNNKIIQRLAPVMLMSPLSVAQYIDLDFPKFDLVIFDEASQIPTGVAVGALSRAKDSIIVGDPNQMPPTSFFKSNYIDEENLHIEDLESLLEDSLAINMPQRFLNWHYRSRSESLIAFSNQLYYRGNMNTFPSPDELNQAVSFEKVEGVYDRGNTSTTLAEAESIVSDIVKRLESGEKQSIGVITFNIKQQGLIEDILENKFAENPNLLKMADQLDERIFVKNLENVQGDERDVILFSIGYGRDNNDKLYMNFGPLNRKGGWRRLNVAVSRARNEMKVFSIMQASDLNIKPSTAEGVKGLYYFLEYAQFGRLPYTNMNQHKKDVESLQNAVQELLTRHGYEVKVNLGMSGITIDLAVIDPEKPNKFTLAILLESEQYRKFATTRDRHRLLPSVLKGLGWDIYRIWSMDWVENQQKEEERLLAYLDNLTNKNREVKGLDFIKVSDASTDLTNKPERIIAGLNTTVDSVNHELKQDGNFIVVEYSENQPDFESTTINDSKLSELMINIINEEGPISENMLLRKTLSYTDSNRLTGKARQTLISYLNSNQYIITSSKDMNFYWPENSDINNYSLIRKPGVVREITDISDYELANAMHYIALNEDTFKDSPDIIEADLIHALVRFYGYGRVTSKMHDVCQSAVNLAINKGYFKRISDEKVILLNPVKDI